MNTKKNHEYINTPIFLYIYFFKSNKQRKCQIKRKSIALSMPRSNLAWTEDKFSII